MRGDYSTLISWQDLKKKKICLLGAPVVAQRVKNRTSIHEAVGSIPGLAQGVEDPALLWLGCGPAAAAPI